MTGRAALWLVVAMVAWLWSQPVSAQAPNRASTPPRPWEAQLLDASCELPSLPPEYLTHEEAGMRFAYHPSTRDRVRPLIQGASELRETLRAHFGAPVLRSIEVRIAISAQDAGPIRPVCSANRTEDQAAELDASAGAGERGLLVMVLGAWAEASRADVESAFQRGMAELALSEATGGRSLPRWIRQGFAVHTSGQHAGRRALTLGWAAARRSLVPLDDLDDELPETAAAQGLAASQAADFVRFLLERDDGQRFSAVVNAVRGGSRFERAIETAYGADLTELERAWRRELGRSKVFLPVLLGALLISLSVALAVALRRWRRRRAALLEQARQTRRSTSRPAMVAWPTPAPRPADPVPAEPLDTIEPADAEVPKVSHDGRWHTLH